MRLIYKWAAQALRAMNESEFFQRRGKAVATYPSGTTKATSCANLVNDPKWNHRIPTSMIEGTP